ncbi:MAG: isochorismate synthase [Bacteroidota bacterium]|nr:isochorismate synthase [Bacteroidota bacterium]
MNAAASPNEKRGPSYESGESFPLNSPVAVFVALCRQGLYPAVLWKSPEQEWLIACGSAHAVRFEASLTGWREAFRETAEKMRSMIGGTPGAGDPSVFFHISFDPADEEGDGSWAGFPCMEFFLPSVLLKRDSAGDSSLLFERTVRGDRERIRSVIETADSEPAPMVEEPLCANLEWNEVPFTLAVEQAVRTLRRRALEKVVLARRAIVTAEREILLRNVLETLLVSYSDCYLYAYAPEAGVRFISASPERLIRSTGGALRTAVLAGTAPTGRNLVEEQEGRLRIQTDQKIWKEHSLVAEMMMLALREIADDVVLEQPEILRLPNVLHLCSPLRGRLLEGRRLADAVALLHPTPAVCGTPRDEARRMIRLLEDFPRGLYTGVAGWFDAAGDGDSVVMIRSALVRGNTAYLFGGAGITEESMIKQEVDETRVKMQAMLSALARG